MPPGPRSLSGLPVEDGSGGIPEHIGYAAPPAGYSGLRGKALRAAADKHLYPTRTQVMQAIPKHCFQKDTARSMMYAAISTALTFGWAALGAAFLPMTWAWAPVWAVHAFISGTFATGMWVAAHECGHGAFSDNKRLQDVVGYALHTVLCVPYFSWQRSHHVHHLYTNHMEKGETHVPYVADSHHGKGNYAMKNILGEDAFVLVNQVFHLVFGWPAYLLSGATGGSEYGLTNHFVPVKPFSDGLFPTETHKKKVWISAAGVLAVIGALTFASTKVGFLPIFLLYVLPYMACNFWLVLYTWLQHTDVDVPHFNGDEWDWVKGTFMTIDRPYGPVLDFLHHRIGSTHVAHHVAHTIPHYHAKEATEALATAFPHIYLYDPTPLHKALWRVSRDCVAVHQHDDQYVFHPTDKTF